MKTKNNKTDSDTLKRIKSGEFQDCYLVYNRKSLDEPNSQKNSLKYQRSENTLAARRHNLTVASCTLTGFCTNGVISEKHSAFKESEELTISAKGMVQFRIDRPKFHQLIHLLSHGYFKGMVCLCWDRVSRNEADDTVIRKLMRKGIDVRFAFAHYDDSSSGQLHMDIDGAFARHHSRVTSEKVSATMTESRSNGKCTHRAPIGYLNTGSVDYKPLDPERAPIIKDMFELYATGEWTLGSIARYAVDHGLTTVPMRRRRTKEEILADEEDELDKVTDEKVSRPITENHVSRIFSNLFYTGRTHGPDGTYIHSSSHEALVDDDLFNQVQAILKRRTVSVHYAEKLDHPLRGIVRCAECKRAYSPYEQKGILYFNCRCVAGCTNKKKNCNLDFITEKICDTISALHFTDNELEVINAQFSTDMALLSEKRQKAHDEFDRRKKRLRSDIDYLRSNKLALLKSGAYTPDSYSEESERLNNELCSAKLDEDISDEALRETFEEAVAFSELLKSIIPSYRSAKPHEKEQIVRLLFSELFITHDKLDFSLKSGLEPFRDRISAVSDPIAWLSELHRQHQFAKSKAEELSQLVEDLSGKIDKEMSKAA